MTIRTGCLLALVVLAVGLQGCIRVPRQAVSPPGIPVTIVPVPSATASEAAGELMAVSEDSVWVARGSEIVSIPLAQVRNVEVRRSGRSAGAVIVYSLLAGLAWGGTLSATCAQVEDADCGNVVPAVLLPWAVLGGLSALTLEPSAGLSFRATDWQALRPYARYPQGLPDSLPQPGLAATLP